MRQKSMQELYFEWCGLCYHTKLLNSQGIEALASEVFNELIICIQSECEKYGIDYSLENLSGDDVYRMEIMNKLNEKYMEEEENKLKQEMFESEIDRAEFYHNQTWE